MEDLLQVGVITTTHGVRGEVKVFPTTDDPARFKKLKNVVLDTGKELVDLEVAGVKFFKNMVIVKFKGIDNINDVEKYRKKSLYVTRENAVKLKKNAFGSLFRVIPASTTILWRALIFAPAARNCFPKLSKNRVSAVIAEPVIAPQIMVPSQVFN